MRNKRVKIFSLSEMRKMEEKINEFFSMQPKGTTLVDIKIIDPYTFMVIYTSSMPSQFKIPETDEKKQYNIIKKYE